MAHKCPARGGAVERGYNQTAWLTGGLIGDLLYSTFGAFKCRNCGKLQRSEFWPDDQSKILFPSIALFVTGVAVVAVLVGVVGCGNSKKSSEIIYLTDGARIVTTTTSTFNGEQATSTTEMVVRKREVLPSGVLFELAMESKSGEFTPPMFVLLSREGIRLSNSGGDVKTDSLMTPAKLYVGMTWSFKQNSETETATMEVEAEEDVTVPAGTFHTFRVSGHMGDWTAIQWISPKVGLVKSELTIHGNTQTTVLEQFTPGREDSASP